MINVITTLSGGGKRAKVYDAQMSLKLPARAKELVKEVAGKLETSEADVVRDALAEYLERRGYRS